MGEGALTSNGQVVRLIISVKKGNVGLYEKSNSLNFSSFTITG